MLRPPHPCTTAVELSRNGFLALLIVILLLISKNLSRVRLRLQITQPHLTTSPFNLSEPLGDWIKCRYHANPNQINDRQTVAVTRRYRRRTGRGRICKKPFRMAITDVSNQDGQPMDQRNVKQIIKQRNAAKDQYRPDPPGRSAVEQRQHQQRRSQRHQQVKQRRRIFVTIKKRKEREQ